MANERSFSRLRRLSRRLQRRQLIRKVPLTRLKDRENPLEFYNAFEFKKRYHMFKDTANHVIRLIAPELVSEQKKGCQLPPTIQFLSVLRFYCTGSFQILIGDYSTLNQSTVSQLIKRVSKVIAKMLPEYVKFPSFPEAASVRERFYEIANFPGVVGAVDCTHVKINSPGGDDAELFRNRKGHFSINVQAVCDGDLNFTNLVARWYGSAHDSRIFDNCILSLKLENQEVPGILLGDSGYALTQNLMTPLKNPRTRPELRYQKAQIKTRNCIERCFGVWKKRYPCLNHLRLKLNTCLVVITALAVLHNISRKRADIHENDYFQPEEDEELDNAEFTVAGRAKQQAIINTYFA